jgi:Tfp pilus assembly protein PilX
MIAMLKSIKNQKGIAMMLLLTILLMMTLLGLGAIMTSTTDVDISGNDLKSISSFYASEAGIEEAEAIIRTSYKQTAAPPSPLPSDTFEINNCTVGFTTVDEGAAVQKTLTVGAYRGLYGLVKRFTITAEATDNATQARTKITQVVEDALVPIFQFAVFYEEDLEVYPGPPMTLAGRVHSNRDIYLGSEDVLYINSYTTAAGDIYYGRKSGSGQGGNDRDVFIKDNYGNYQNMVNDDGTKLDSNDPEWVAKALDRWGGMVEDRSFGMTELNLPLVTSGDEIDIIKRGDGNSDSFEHKAGLKIVDGKAWYKNADDSWTDVTATFTADGILTTGSFYNGREMKNVTTWDIDISKLNTSDYFPSNGIIYAARQEVAGTEQAIRLKNAQELSGPLTVASENPLYTWGDYNTVNKQPAAVLTDALTILSNNWSDSKSTWGISSRVASNTQVNVSFMTGNTNSENSTYSGGLENLPRFLEAWSGKTFTYRGSMVDLWFSEQATGLWSYGSYYTAPYRDWAFDNDLLDPAKLPPGTPLINAVQKVSWLHRLVSN